MSCDIMLPNTESQNILVLSGRNTWISLILCMSLTEVLQRVSTPVVYSSWLQIRCLLYSCKRFLQHKPSKMTRQGPAQQNWDHARNFFHGSETLAHKWKEIFWPLLQMSYFELKFTKPVNLPMKAICNKGWAQVIFVRVSLWVEIWITFKICSLVIWVGLRL